MTEHADHQDDATQREQAFRRDFTSYIWGYGLALALTLLPFALVYWKVLERVQVLVIIAVCAVVQMVVHFRFFLHIGLNRQREDLHLILFSALILAIMIAGTLWIMFNLSVRMSPAGAGM